MTVTGDGVSVVVRRRIEPVTTISPPGVSLLPAPVVTWFDVALVVGATAGLVDWSARTAGVEPLSGVAGGGFCASCAYAGAATAMPAITVVASSEPFRLNFDI